MQFEKWTRYSAQNLEISEILIHGFRNILLILLESFWNLQNLERGRCKTLGTPIGAPIGVSKDKYFGQKRPPPGGVE